MSDEQIIVMYRGIRLATERGQKDDGLNLMSTGDGLFARFAREVGELGASNPERLKTMVRWLTEGRPIGKAGDPDPDREFAARIVPGLIDYDYEFTRETLVSLTVDEDGTYCDSVESWVPDTAEIEIRRLMRDHLTAEQIADFNLCLASLPRRLHEDFWPLEPAPPDATSHDE
ncbi:hypothetical protein [Nocardia abscessus]|uniref:hypothetical protein n=1 Tax=Nocardia abscessus TaxID=120957 RepID=UPI002455AEA8|nr:hypothetical protein [Nocardia abscessus]